MIKILKHWATLDNKQRRAFYRKVNFNGGLNVYEADGSLGLPVGMHGSVKGEIAKKEKITHSDVFVSSASRKGHTKTKIDERLAETELKGRDNIFADVDANKIDEE